MRSGSGECDEWESDPSEEYEWAQAVCLLVKVDKVSETRKDHTAAEPMPAHQQVHGHTV